MDSFAPLLLFQCSTEQRTWAPENWVTALSELQHHHFCLRVPFSIWFVMEGPITPFPRLWGREKTSLLHEIGVRTLIHAMNFCSRCFCCLFIVQSMSLCIDMKMMRSFKSCGRISSSSPFNFWTSWRSCVDVCVRKILHSNTTASASMLSSSRSFKG